MSGTILSRMPTVSICLPAYNGERFLAEAIDSALAQTFTDFELLIADDCSTDRTSEIVLSYASKDKRIVYWRNERNLGLFQNYNRCMQKASGELIKPFAQDDIWDPKIVERMVSTFREHPDLALMGVFRTWITADGAEIETHQENDETKLIPGREVIRSCLLSLVNWIGEPSTVMFPKAYIGSGFDGSYYHLGDLEYWFRLLRNGQYFFLNEPLCKFRRHDSSTTNKNLKGLLFAIDMMRLGDVYEDVLLDSERTVAEFKIDAIKSVAPFIGYLSNLGEITLEELLAQKPADDATAREQLTQFKELAYFALLWSARREEEFQSQKQTLEHELFAVESQLAAVLNSRYWKSTALIREAVRKVKPSPSANLD